MKKIFIICCVMMGLACGAEAQLLDTIAAGGVGAAGTQASVKSVRQGLSMMQQNKIIQNLNMMIMDIKMNSLRGYEGLSKNDYQGSTPFGRLDWDIGSVGNEAFFIEIRGMDAGTCRRLLDSVRDYQSVTLNNKDLKNTACSDNNKIKWIFE